MNTGEYIESGILETYVLGMLSAEENSEVEAMAREYPEVKAALEDLQSTMAAMADAQSVKPNPEWKSAILSAAIGETTPDSNPAPPSPSRPEVKPITSGREPAKKERSSSFSFLAIAATVILLISLGINILQYFTLERIEDQLESTQLRIAELESENQIMVANYRQAEQNLAVMRDPHTATFVMKGVEGRDPSYRANIYWHSTTEMVYLDVLSLPQAPSGKQYQLWALKDGKPIDMGVFDALDTDSGLLKMGAVPGADAFAVTLENAGGVASPTIEEMYVYGTPLQS